MNYFVEFLNKDKKFAKDIKYFETFEDARNWCLETFDKYDPDYIKTI